MAPKFAACLIIVVVNSTACGGKDSGGGPGGNAGTDGSDDHDSSAGGTLGSGGPSSGGTTSAGGNAGTSAGDSGGSSGEPQVVDAGLCITTPPPACQSNGWPFCAPDWATAKSWYPSCPPESLDQPYLARCGDYDAIVVPGAYVSRRYFYDARGRLVGFDGVANGTEHHCSAYSPSFLSPPISCIAAGTGCPDAGPTSGGIDAGAFGWDGGPPECTTGQAAYDAYLAAQLAQFNTCTLDAMCIVVGSPGAIPPLGNPCIQPCNLALPIVALNDQIMARLDRYGQMACALCTASPPPACPLVPPFGRCVEGKCVVGAP